MNNNAEFPPFAARVQMLARTFPYPPTPNLTGRVRLPLRGGQLRWRAGNAPVWVWVLVLIGVAFAGLMAVPSVRAAVLAFIQIGVIRIFPGEVLPPLPSIEDLPVTAPETEALPTPSFILASVLDLAGEVTLEQARELVDFPILLPAYPPDVGAPDRVFYQALEGGPGVFLVWLDPASPERVQLSLLLLGPGAYAGKGGPNRMVETTIHGTPAIWMEGEHFLLLRTVSEQYETMQFFVQGHVLVWTVAGITYRLESEWTMEEAIMAAESLR